MAVGLSGICGFASQASALGPRHRCRTYVVKNLFDHKVCTFAPHRHRPVGKPKTSWVSRQSFHIGDASTFYTSRWAHKKYKANRLKITPSDEFPLDSRNSQEPCGVQFRWQVLKSIAPLWRTCLNTWAEGYFRRWDQDMSCWNNMEQDLAFVPCSVFMKFPRCPSSIAYVP